MGILIIFFFHYGDPIDSFTETVTCLYYSTFIHCTNSDFLIG